MKHYLLTIFAVVSPPFLYATPAQAQAARTWVSGVGDDANPRFRSKKLQPAEWPEYKAISLFDGLNSFNIGYGDVVFNLKQRIKNFARRGTPAALILDELFERVCKFDTVFSRWRAEHTHEPTRW